MQVGDRVLYVPHESHALQKDVAGDYPWELEWEHQPEVLGPEGEVLVAQRVEKLTGGRVEEQIAHLRRLHSADPELARAVKAQHLKLVRPCKCFPAVVRAVRDDGAVDLDVASNQGGVTLHYDAVPVARPGEPRFAHSCFAEGD